MTNRSVESRERKSGIFHGYINKRVYSLALKVQIYSCNYRRERYVKQYSRIARVSHIKNVSALTIFCCWHIE